MVVKVLKFRFLFLLLLFISKEGFSQLLIGPSAGANLSWVAFEDKELKNAYKMKPVWAYHAGATLSFRVQKRFFLHTGFIYSQKGRSLEGLVDLALREKVKYSYFEIPILYTIEFKSTVGKNKEYKWYVGAGPNVSYWLSGKGTLEASELREINHIDKLDYKIAFNKNAQEITDGEVGVEEPNRLQLGINFGGGLVFQPIPNHTFMIMMRYELGHSFLSKSGDGIYPSLEQHQHILKASNQGLRISLAYLLDTKIEQRKKGKSTIKNNTPSKRRR